MTPTQDFLNQQYDANGVMTIEWQAQMIQMWLDDWAQARGGYAKVLANMRHLWEEIFMTDERPRILICFNGEQARGGFNQANLLHRVDRQWIVAVIRGHGFTNQMAKLDGPTAAVDPFYKDCQTVRDKCRVLVNISEEPPVDYKGMDPLPSAAPYGQTANIFLDGYGIKFSTANDIPAITQINPDA
jgi:hypothetical protein